MTLEEYLEKVSAFAGNDYGRMVRNQFQDIGGCSELAMLASPNRDELEQLRRAVAIMTPDEKAGAADLTDEQIQRIAEDAHIDTGTLAIFINGYILESKRVS
jgi:hypothetical protein